MGNILLKLSSAIWSKQIKVLMVGLDAAGKTTALYKLKLGDCVTTIPTVGFNVETFEHRGTSFTVWDVSGRSGIRALWKHYFQNTDAIIFMLDSSDRDRIGECKSELWRLLNDDDLKDAIILVMANKQDIPGAMSVEEVKESLQIQDVKERNLCVQGAVVNTGEGLYEGLTWIQERMAERSIIQKSSDPSHEGEPATSSGKLKPRTWWSTITGSCIRTPN